MEILVVIAVLSLVGAMVVVIFTRSLQGSTKSQILLAIKQNGQAVLETMDKTVRGADSVVCVSNLSNPTIVTVRDGFYTRYRFIEPTAGNNGRILQDTPVPPSSPGPGDLELFLDNVCTSALTGANTLTDTNQQTGVSIDSSSFTKDQLAGFKDKITIKLVLKPGVEAPAVLAGQIDPVTFQTTIELR